MHPFGKEEKEKYEKIVRKERRVRKDHAKKIYSY